MLIDFSFSNFRSFRDEQAFSMSSSDTKLPPSTVTAVYGANASGKSNFLKAMGSMATLVRLSYSQGSQISGVPREPFLLSDFQNGQGEPSMFLAEFVAADGQKYNYWFTFDSQKILSESLSVYKKLNGRLSTRSTKLFERGEDQTNIDFGNAFGPSGLLQQTMNNRPNALVLSAAAAAGIPSIQTVFDFFMPDNYFYGEASQSQMEMNYVAQQLEQHTKFSKNLTKLLRYADFGINNVRAVPVNFNSISDSFSQFKKQMHESIGADEEKLDQLLGQNPKQIQLQFEHTGANGIKRQFIQGQESQGTIGAMSFFSVALRQLSHQSVTLVDEIDTSLHPTLVKELVSLFVDPETNPHGSQLIFTTHDTTLINASGDSNRLLKGDQIWFVEKGQDGASEIYPATDMKLRSKENIGKNYMNGVYGAVPRPTFHSLFAQIINGEDGEEDESGSSVSGEDTHE
ncbi:ATP-binding protein [Bifidobacterium sp. ESL0745]|uniref:AAA family ATPase n=1 Tax=Bifidobacterium sp. ESL0745 TaxID=2983226 RepID=UPI0023F8561F|nr:ATP-binding protein [Bifidobacterium sp. ESL0745]MDF7665356.1 ATP-binding protein [Bifidobacterium sp. ESL0745]